jgi:nucleoside-diphosphate-sugar epimerase
MAHAIRTGIMPLLGGGNSTLAVVHAANVAEGAILAATNDQAGGRVFNLANDYDVTVREFFTLAARGLGQRVTFVPIPIWMAKLGLRGFRVVDRVMLGAKFAVATEGSLSFMSRDNPFTSDRAKQELGWNPSVRPEVGIPEAFRWWKTQKADPSLRSGCRPALCHPERSEGSASETPLRGLLAALLLRVLHGISDADRVGLLH